MTTKHIALSLLLATSCLTTDDDPELEAVDQDVTFGTIISNAASVGGVQLLKSGNLACSGTMLTADWLITAASCGPLAGDTVRLGNASDTAAQVSTIDRVVKHPGVDLALVKLRRAFDVQGRGAHYKLSVFSDIDKTLLGKRNTFYGSSGGSLRSAPLDINKIGSHFIGGSSFSVAQTGDMGGGLIYETASGRELTGVLKSTLSSGVVRPDAIRRWALSYLYDRPVRLPDLWSLGSNGHTFAVPLLDNYTEEVTWDVCPGSPSYLMFETYADLKPGDYIDLTSNSGTTTLSSAHPSHWGYGSGPLRIRVRTDGSGRSRGFEGYNELKVQCLRGLEFPNPWGTPSPAGTSDIEFWDPCPGGAPWTWTAEHAYGPDGSGQIGNRALSGTGTTSGTTTGETFIYTSTPSGGTGGLRKLTARCDLAIHCHGSTCFSRGEGTTPTTATVTLDPCNGRPFDVKVTTALGFTEDRLTIGPFVHTSDFNQVWRTFGGPTQVSLRMQYPNTDDGLVDMVTRCFDWGTDRTSQINVISGSYGRNCGVNRDNATQRLDAFCKNQTGTCNFPIRTSELGDPAYGCAKDFTYQWTCGQSTNIATLVVPGEADGKTAVLRCPY